MTAIDLTAVLTDATTRRAVVAELYLLAGTATRNGDRAFANGRYALANGNWTTWAQCIRVAQAIAAGKDLNPADTRHVEEAYGRVRDRAAAEAVSAR